MVCWLVVTIGGRLQCSWPDFVTDFTKCFPGQGDRRKTGRVMHETGLAEAIIKTLRKVQAEREDAIRVLRLQVGELSGITPEHLAEHFYEAAQGTEFEHVKLEIEVRGIMAKCAACEAVFEVTDDVEACPECESQSIGVQADDGVKLVFIE